MNYREIPVCGLLSHFIKSFWEFENTESDSTFDILPDGVFDLILEPGKGQMRKVILTGVWTEQMTVAIPRKSRLIGIRFKLIASEYILQRPVSPYLNSQTQLPIDFIEVNQLPTNDLGSFATAFYDRILPLIVNPEKTDTRKLELFRRLYGSHGEVSVGQLAQEIHWSARQINRYFTKQFGLSAKTFADILKCHSSFPQIAKGDLYPERKYFDQAHFIRHVKRYTGVSPKVLYHNKNDRFIQFSTLRGR